MPRKKYLAYRPEVGMRGPYWFEPRAVAAIRRDLRGVYLLTHEGGRRGATPVVTYVGRGRVRERLAAHLADERKHALQFRFKIVDDEGEAFEEECRLFHAYGRSRHLDNRIHPAISAGVPPGYPRCAMRDRET